MKKLLLSNLTLWAFSAMPAFAANQQDADDAIAAMQVTQGEAASLQSSALTRQSELQILQMDAHAAYSEYQMMHGSSGTIEDYLEAGDELMEEGEDRLLTAQTWFMQADVLASDADMSYMESEWDCVVLHANDAKHYYKLAKTFYNSAIAKYDAAAAQFQAALGEME